MLWQQKAFVIGLRVIDELQVLPYLGEIVFGKSDYFSFVRAHLDSHRLFLNNNKGQV